MKKDLTTPVGFIATSVKAGFPNPAEDALSGALNINDLIVRHPVSTYYLRVDGDSMAGAGIATGDIVVVDKSLDPKNGDIVVAVIDGDFSLKILKRDGQHAWLATADPEFPPLALHETADVQLWGVVTYTIHKNRA